MQALILAGGSGTRFWPVSRQKRPKQLLTLEGDVSLLQATVKRLSPLIEPNDVWVVTTRILADAVRLDVPEIPEEQVLAEPCGRNTAPAIGWSLVRMPEDKRRGIVAVLPADHRFEDPAGFRRVLDEAARVVERDDRVMTLGVTPRWAETGYGYLELGETLDEDSLRAVARFTEKPDAATAERYFEAKSHLWNAGIFVFRGTTLLEHLKNFEPDLGRGLDAIAADPGKTEELYPKLPKTSIDYAVMERLDSIGTLPLEGWSDLGSWQALAEILPADADGNRCRGDVMAVDARDNLLYADAGSVAVVGVEGLAVVRTGDTVLVLPRERSQEVRKIVDLLKREKRAELL